MPEPHPGSFALLPPDADYPYFICGRDVLRSQNMSMQRLGTVLVTVDIEKLLNNQIDALSTSRQNSTFIIRKRSSTKAARRRRILHCRTPARAMPCRP